MAINKAPLYGGYHCCTTSFSKALTQVLRMFKSYSPRVGNLRREKYLTMAGNMTGSRQRRCSVKKGVLKNFSIFQILPIRLHLLWTFLTDFQWDMSAKVINIYNLCYNALVLKKICKTFQKCSFRTLFRQKHGPGQKSSSNFFLEITKEIISLQEPFILSKCLKFWLSHGWFFVLWDILLPKRAISG